ncbi:cobalt-precorrin-6A reductase [Chamaesiphon sp. VAR_48_metabat_135_sub]|uniref:cobalt-precorrin-6A reductase n=1 Tax=Chamaesiphon sp. VAR_48_metabat_135_sub TaxID=2964699 RepID=UPI00286ABDFA|nr:cobalt-precorrin-6A reductase [Chamaesiphon sp. VAR_48_metabat_135_sub]
MKRLLILGGTGDAVRLASLAIDLPGLAVITSLAGRTIAPKALAGAVRIGGFGGEVSLVEYLQTENIDLLIDATHPFAARISGNAAGAATRVGIPRLMLIRPGWVRSDLDDWIEVESVEAAVGAIPTRVERIFLTIGRQQLAPFASLADKWCLMRSIDPPDPIIPLPPGELLLDRGPFSLEQELQLLRDYRIQAIVSKNSGGDATYAKIIAARELGLPVIMVQRSIVPEGDRVGDVLGAMKWLRERNSNLMRS